MSIVLNFMFFLEKPKISFDSSLPETMEVHASGTLKLIASVSVCKSRRGQHFDFLFD